MLLLATTRGESTILAVGMSVLLSCVLLMIYRPRQTELAGTPHQVPVIALLVAIGWVLLVAGTPFVVTAPEKEPTLNVAALWVVCAIGVFELAIVATAYVVPRRLAAASSSVAPVLLEGATDATVDAVEQTQEESTSATPQASGDWAHQAGVGMTVGLAAMVPTALAAAVLQPNRDPEEMHVLLRALQGHGWDYLSPIFLAAAVLAPLKEELVFRVILQGRLADLIGKWAIPITAVLFSAIHGANDAPLLVPLALILGALYEYRRSYIEVVAAHAAFNAANLIAAVNQ